MPEAILDITPSTETGKLQVMHLKRYWEKSLLKRNGKLQRDSFAEEWKADTTLLSMLGLGLEQTVVYVYRESPAFDQFEDWIVETAGMPDPKKAAAFNLLFSPGNTHIHGNAVPDDENVLTSDELGFWDEHGYVIVRNAVSREDCDETIALICAHLGIDRHDPDTWYKEHPSKQGIMIQLFQHPLLDNNRRSAKIRKAYEQLWERKDIWVNTDRVGFNPPETPRLPFPGPRLHWDASIAPPVLFGTQGILYLADTAENQGAFTLVPGFHHRVESWLLSLPADANPRMENLYALGPKPIAANAGDFIIWHQALPHGSSPNTSALPRFVQYINYEPADKVENPIWL